MINNTPTNLQAIAICCRNSARMLQIADDATPKLKELNGKQADLLWHAAHMAETADAERAALVVTLRRARDVLTAVIPTDSIGFDSDLRSIDEALTKAGG